MSDAELRDQLVTLLLAGHETTATALAWAFERLLRHPRVLARLARDRSTTTTTSTPWSTRRCGVRPVIVDVGRKLTRAAEVGGCQLPAGTLVLPSIALAARAPDALRGAGGFRPERFLDGAARVIRLDPVRRRHTALHRRVFAQLEMKDRASRGAEPRRLRARPTSGARRHQARDGGARARLPRLVTERLPVEAATELAGAPTWPRHRGRAGRGRGRGHD